MNILDDSCRVALAGLLHDLGKFAERARLDVDTDYYRQDDCPQFNGKATHIHAAYTGVGFAVLEKNGLLPALKHLQAAPFASTAVDDSLINAAARHHRPQTALQWIIATADRLASGFERSNFADYNAAGEPANAAQQTQTNHYTTRLLSLSARLLQDKDSATTAWVQPLSSLSPKTIFPAKSADITPKNNAAAQSEYKKLWEEFVKELKKIPDSHQQNLPLWLDHFDSAWLAFTHAIPSATAGQTIPDVSLYDHSKAVAALAVALWQWHEDQKENPATTARRLSLLWDKDQKEGQEATAEHAAEKFLLIQGDFAGIQNFIFAEGSETQKAAAKLLRGRSFQVSLLCELAALKVLERLGLPPTSQVMNAAGKFLIVAANTAQTRDKLRALQSEFDTWFLRETFGRVGRDS